MKSHLTAMTRTKVSAPTSLLVENWFITPNDKVLDYGCGKGFDANTFGFDKYDPHFFPDLPNNKYDKIICNYVLNVVDEKTGYDILNNIRSHLNDFGVAYISVRRDVKIDGITKKGTFQRNVILPLQKIEENSNFCIYKLNR